MNAATSQRLVPRRWLRLPRHSARLRLTLMYSGLFLLLGTAIIALIFFLARTGTSVSVSQAFPGGLDQTHVISAQQSAVNGRLLAVSWFALAVSAVASAFLGWFAAGRVLRPLRQMTAGARAISAGNLHQRLAVTGPNDEFKQLGDTIDDLLARLEAAFAAQRRFVANAAHELRTPLTLERTLLQVALTNPNATMASLRAACEELLVSGRNQERLLEALLTLATSERGLQRLDALDLAPLVQDAAEGARPGIERRRIELSLMLGHAPMRGDRALIERLIGNLLDNAIDHNRDEGWVRVMTGADSERAVLRVANSGPAITSDEIDRLFEPFQRGGVERTAANGHYGLGLSIARAIVLAHDGEISAEPELGGGLMVTVTLPVA
jgi:signal transduction histidine kinase